MDFFLSSLLILINLLIQQNIFCFKANSAIISEGHFILTDESIPVQVDFKKLNTSITDFLLYGPDVSTYQ
jgi:hypothetical protein